MHKIHLFLFLLISSVLNTMGQSAAPVKKGLKVGDRISNDIKFRKLINFSADSATISDFRGKLLILDFWSSACVSCVQSWPKLMELQKQFSPDLQILMVNAWEERDKIEELIKKRERLTGIKFDLPTTAGDSTILRYFDISGLPHVIWVDTAGVIKSISYGASLTSKNIASMLKGRNVEMAQKIIEYTVPEFDKPLFVNGNGGDVTDPIFSAIFTKALPTMYPYIGLVSNIEGRSFITATKSSLKELYMFAYSNRVQLFDPGKHSRTQELLTMLQPASVVLEMKDTTHFVGKINDELINDNFYNYQIITSAKTREQLQLQMQADLKRLVGYKVKWEKRERQCLILRAYDTNMIKYKGGETKFMVSEGIKLNNVPTSKFISLLEDFTEYYFSPYPIIDETNFSGKLGDINIDIDIMSNTDPEVLNQGLKKYKMSFTLETRSVNTLVISDPSDN